MSKSRIKSVAMIEISITDDSMSQTLGREPHSVAFAHDINAIATARPACRICCRVETLAKAMGALEGGDGMHFVVYDLLGLFAAARVWWTLRAYGVEEIRILYAEPNTANHSEASAEGLSRMIPLKPDVQGGKREGTVICNSGDSLAKR